MSHQVVAIHGNLQSTSTSRKALALKHSKTEKHLRPIGSMYAIYDYIYHQYTPVMLAYIPYMDPMGDQLPWDFHRKNDDITGIILWSSRLLRGFPIIFVRGKSPRKGPFSIYPVGHLGQLNSYMTLDGSRRS